MLGGAIQPAGHASRPALGQRERDLARLVDRFLLEIVECIAAEIEPAFERAVDPDVEPALDAAADEQHGSRIHQRAGQHGDQREHQHEAHREAGAEDAGPSLAPQLPQLGADHRHQPRAEEPTTARCCDATD